MTDPNNPKHNQNTSEGHTDGAGLGKALADAITARIMHARTGPVVEHRTHLLKEPTKVGVFGSFREELRPTEYGTPVLGELEGGAGAVVWTGFGDYGNYQMAIGFTPEGLDPRKGGQHIRDAGEPGDFLAWREGHPEGAASTAGTTYKYLSREDIEGMVVKAGRPIEVRHPDSPLSEIDLSGDVTQSAAFRGSVE